MKLNHNTGRYVNAFFWRTHRQQEIDYLEESEGSISAYELKWREGKNRVPKAFKEAYPDCAVHFIHRGNFERFAGLE